MSTTTYTPDQQRDAHIAMAEKFNSDEVQSSLNIDLENFTKTVKTISNSFDVVERKLTEVDSLGLDPSKFTPTWTGYKNRYRKLLWGSRDLATLIATQSEQFATVMLPIASGEADPSVSMSDRADGIKDFIQTNEVQGKKSEEMKNQFQALADEINVFKGTFSSFAEKQLKDANEKIKTLESELAGLRSEMESINTKILGLSIGLGLIIFATVALCIVFPAATAQIATAGVAAATGAAGALGLEYDKRSKVASQITTKTQELKNATNTVKQIEKARADLKSLADNEVSTITAGLLMLSDIWRNVNSDCKQVEEYLRSAQKSADMTKDPKAPAALSAYVKKGVSIYTGLAKALRLYASGIDNSQ
jgi:archaellum component FlaC